MSFLNKPLVFGLSILLNLAGWADETPEREWTSTAGTTITGTVTELNDGVASIVSKNGRKLKVPLNKLSPSDQAYLNDFFEGENTDASPAAVAVGKSETVGPIDAGDGSSYFLYLPKTLVPGGSAPLLFWTGSGESHAKTLNHWKKTADIIGIALACSKEAKNGKKPKSNGDHTRTCLKHIQKTVPVDIRRVIFSGGSGGGVSSIRNCASLPCIGAIPFIAWEPEGTRYPKNAFFYFGTGAHDYNRYSTAEAVSNLGKRATHRLYPGGHTITGWEPAEDGLLWVYTRHLYADRSRYLKEAEAFEPRLLAWIKELATTKPHEAYYWVDHLLNTCNVSGGIVTELDDLFETYSANADSIMYLRGRQELEKFSKRFLSNKPGGSLRGHTTDQIQRSAKKFQTRYEGIADLGQIFADLAKKTD